VGLGKTGWECAPDVDELFGFLVRCEVVNVDHQWVKRDDLGAVLVGITGV